MPPRFQSPPSLLAPTAFAILGVAYCLFIYLGVGESVCVTAGCSLYKSFSIAGISMWILGIVAFVCLTLLMAAGVYTLSLYLARLFLAGDCVLLLVMATTSPCLSCLGVAFLFAVTYFLLRHADHSPQKKSSALLFVWSLLFVANLILSAREMLPPEPIYGPAEAPVHIYFSPSCNHCLAAMDTYKLADGQVAYYATAHDDNDVSMLIALRQKLADGGKMPGALKDVIADSSARPAFTWTWDNIMLQWQIWRNKSTIWERNSGFVPYITIGGFATGGRNPEIVQGENLGETVRVAPVPPVQTDVPSLREGGSFGDTDVEPLLDTGQMFGNATSFGVCSDESPENCD